MKKNDATRENLSKGIGYINKIIGEVQDIIEKGQSPIYDMPDYIFRGITKFYPSKKNKKDSEKPSQYRISDIERDYIKSGHAIRIGGTFEKYGIGKTHVRANYVSSLKEMISNAHKHYPEKYPEDMCDLDVLADIQHNGGATCLIDFSRNFLTALWFACKDDPDSNGYIYCYDVMKDMIENDALTYIRPEDEKMPIEDLLNQTYRETNISSDFAARFCLWEPSPRNNRILRQDSIFLFGIEAFHVKDHGIKVITIEAKNKKDILFAMKHLFRISNSTIYNDPVGFASGNAKTTISRKVIDSAYNRGYTNMVKGEYDSALDFFKLWEGEKEKELAEKESLELHFSLAVCYKNIQRHQNTDANYYENAILEYRKVIVIGKQILDTCKNSYERSYYKQKCTRAYNGIIDVEYLSGKYREAIMTCNQIIKDIENGILKSENPNSKLLFDRRNKALNPKYCKITKLEMLNLEILTNYDIYEKNKEGQKETMKEYLNDAKKEKALTQFDRFLIKYYESIFNVLMIEESVDDLSEEGYKEANDNMEEFFTWANHFVKKGGNIYKGYLLWDFKDMKEAIDAFDSVGINKQRVMQYITAYAIGFRDKYNMQSFGKVEDF